MGYVMTTADNTKANIAMGKAESARIAEARDNLGRVSSLLKSINNNQILTPQAFATATEVLNNSAPISQGAEPTEPVAEPVVAQTPTPVAEPVQSEPMVIPRADSNYNPKKSKGIAMATFN